MPEDQTGIVQQQPDTVESVGTVGDIAQHNLDQAAKWMGDKATLERLAQSDDTWTSLHAKQQLRAIKDEELARESAATPEDVHAKLREDINRVAKGVAGGTIVPKPGEQSMPQEEFVALANFVEAHADEIGLRVDAQKVMQNPSNNGNNGSK